MPVRFLITIRLVNNILKKGYIMVGLFAKMLESPVGIQIAGKAAKIIGIGGAVTGWGIYHAVTGKGVLDVAGGHILGEEFEKKGLGGGLKKAVLGEDGVDKGLVEGVVDTSLGEGAYQKMGDTAGQVVDSVGNGVRAARDAAGNLISEAAGAMQGGGQQQQPMYVDPNTGYYPQQTMMNGGASQFTGMFNSIPQMIGNATGSHVTMTNLAGLLASMYMMMGPFGWMGKIASLLTGNMALKSMRQQPAYAMPQQGYNPMMQQQPYYPAAQPMTQQQQDNAVVRTRHM